MTVSHPLLHPPIWSPNSKQSVCLFSPDDKAAATGVVLLRALLPQRAKRAGEIGTGASASVSVGHPLTPAPRGVSPSAVGLRRERPPSQPLMSMSTGARDPSWPSVYSGQGGGGRRPQAKWLLSHQPGPIPGPSRGRGRNPPGLSPVLSTLRPGHRFVLPFL